MIARSLPLLLLVGCAAPPATCSMTPERVVAGEPMALSLQLRAWAGRGDVQVEAFADGEPAAGRWERSQHGHAHAVVRMGTASEVRLTGLRAPTTAGPVRPVVLRGGKRVCEDLQLVVDPGPPVALELVGPATARPGGDVAIGLRRVDAGGHPVPGEGPWRLSWRRVDGRSLAGPSVPLGRSVVPAPPPGVWVPVADGAEQQAVGNPLLVADDAPRECWADLHGHGALSDGWRDPEAWFAHARDVAFLDAAALSEHTWRSAAFDPSPRARASADGVLSVPHTTLDPSMGADLPHRRLPGLRLVEVYSAHGSSVDRGGWRSMRDSEAEPRTSVHELLQRASPSASSPPATPTTAGPARPAGARCRAG